MRTLLILAFVFAIFVFDQCTPVLSQIPGNGIAFEKDGFRVVGWLPFNDHPNGSVTIDDLPSGQRSIDLPVKLYFTGEPFGNTAKFLLCMATGPKLDARALTLVAVDSRGQEIHGLRHSTDTERVGSLQLVVFRARLGVHFKRIAKLVVLSNSDRGQLRNAPESPSRAF